MADQDSTTSKPSQPWWRDPWAVSFGFVILLASGAILAKGWIAPPQPVDPLKPAVVSRDGSFCDIPAQTQSTLEKPKPIGGNAER